MQRSSGDNTASSFAPHVDQSAEGTGNVSLEWTNDVKHHGKAHGSKEQGLNCYKAALDTSAAGSS